jgi:hypothetical protein
MSFSHSELITPSLSGPLPTGRQAVPTEGGAGRRNPNSLFPFHLLPLFNGQLALRAEESRKRMGIGDAFLSETPIDDIPHGQFFLESMAKTQAHPTHNADGHGIFIYPLLSTNITLHLFRSSLPNSIQCF